MIVLLAISGIAAYKFLGPGAEDISKCKKFIEKLYSINAINTDIDLSDIKYEKVKSANNKTELTYSTVVTQYYGIDLDKENDVIGFAKKDTNFIKDEDKIKKPKKCISTRQLKTLYTLSLSSDFSFTKINEKHSKKNSNTSNNNTSNNFSSKTSSNFFKAESKSPFNINNLINRVIENNKKAAAAKSKDFFGEIGKDFMNNHMRKTNTNFYQSSSSNRYQNQKENINPKQPKTLNSLEITLLNPIEWRKHEEIWANI